MINIRLSSFTYGPIVTSSSVPEELSPLLIPGSEAAYAEGSYGKILLQEIQAGEITLLYNIYQIKQDLALDFNCSTGTLRTHIALKNDSQYHIKGIGEFYLSEGQFNIIDAPKLEGTYFTEHDNEYHTLHIFFSPDLLDKLLPVFDYLQEWLATDTETARPLYKIHSWLTPQLKDIVDRIVNCPYSNDLLLYYRELKAKEFLCLALTPRHNELTTATRLSRRTLRIIHDFKRTLDEAFERQISIAEISREIGMNEFKLKAGFKQVFGISTFDYLVKKRMQAARNLLLETDKPIKEIASLTGYSTKQSFLNAFKRYFHDTPGSFRKN